MASSAFRPRIWVVEIISPDLRALPITDGVRTVHQGIHTILDLAEHRLTVDT